MDNVCGEINATGSIYLKVFATFIKISFFSNCLIGYKLSGISQFRFEQHFLLSATR